MGITLQQLYEQYTPRTLFNHLNGYWDHNNRYMRTMWETARFNLVPQLNVHMKKSKMFKTDADYCRFPWESQKSAPAPLAKLTEQEKQKIKEAFNPQ